MEQRFVETRPGFFADGEYIEALKKAGLDSVAAVFDFEQGSNLAKANLAKHRSRVEFHVESIDKDLFLKRYNNTPKSVQTKNFIAHKKIKPTMFYDLASAIELAAAGINTPKTICYGSQGGPLFEKRSFIITEKIPGQSLEKKLPRSFDTDSADSVKAQRQFIDELACFARKFHETGFRHRDFYLAHIFYCEQRREFFIIDLQRALRPTLLKERFRVKDIAQLFYSAPRKHFSATARLRFFLKYAGASKLTVKDKSFIHKVIRKAWRMEAHDRRHGRIAPFAS